MKMRSVASDELHVMMQRRLSQEDPVQASEAELAQRLQRLTVLAVNRIIYHGRAGAHLSLLRHQIKRKIKRKPNRFQILNSITFSFLTSILLKELLIWNEWS